jgi:hypothetical protein
VIRFTGMQSRIQGVVALGGLVAVAIALALTGPHLAQLYHAILTTCAAQGDCSTALTQFVQHNDAGLRTGLGVLVVVVPGLLGIFWGAPLVAREIEAGTYRLAWTQSITRTRWLAVKLGVLGLASTAVAGLLSLMVTWWASPLDRALMDRFQSFEQRDFVPLGYAAFAFVLGVALGTLIRRTLPAMAATLGAFLAVRIAVTTWVRPHLFSPLHQVLALDPVSTGYGSNGTPGPANLLPGPPYLPSAWVYSTHIVDNSGRQLSPQVVANACPSVGGGGGGGGGGPAPGIGGSKSLAPASAQSALQDCVRKIGATYHELATYQPAHRYWAFQWSEFAIFLALALALAGFCLWWLGRRSA